MRRGQQRQARPVHLPGDAGRDILVSAMSRRKAIRMTQGEHRRLRVRQVLFAILAILVIASFVISLLTTF